MDTLQERSMWYVKYQQKINGVWSKPRWVGTDLRGKAATVKQRFLKTWGTDGVKVVRVYFKDTTLRTNEL